MVVTIRATSNCLKTLSICRGNQCDAVVRFDVIFRIAPFSANEIGTLCTWPSRSRRRRHLTALARGGGKFVTKKSALDVQGEGKLYDFKLGLALLKSGEKNKEAKEHDDFSMRCVDPARGEYEVAYTPKKDGAFDLQPFNEQVDSATQHPLFPEQPKEVGVGDSQPSEEHEEDQLREQREALGVEPAEPLRVQREEADHRRIDTQSDKKVAKGDPGPKG